MDSSNGNTRTKKMIVITPDQIAKLGLTLKLQSVIAPQLQKRKSLQASTTGNTTPVNKNARKARAPKALTKKLDGGSRNSLPATKTETSVKDDVSAVVGDLVVRPDALKAKLRSVLNRTEPEAAKPKATPKKKTNPRISKVKQAEKVPENAENPLNLEKNFEEIATTPISKSNKKTPRNSKKVVPANQPSIKSFCTSTPTNSKFTIIQNEKVNLNQNTIDSIMSETKMSSDGTVRLSDSIILGNTSPKYSTTYKSPERFSGDNICKVDLGNKGSYNKKDSHSVSEGGEVVDKKEEKKIRENVGLTEGRMENLDIKKTVEETSKIENKSGSGIKLESEIDKCNELGIKEVNKRMSVDVVENTEGSEKDGNVQNSKSSEVTKDVKNAVAKGVTRRGRVKIAPKLAPKLVSDDSKNANIGKEQSCKTIEDIEVIGNQYSSSTSDNNLNVGSQEKIEESSEDSVKLKIEASEDSKEAKIRSRKSSGDSVKLKIEAPEDSRVANRRSRIKAVLNIKPNVNLEANKEILEHDKKGDKESIEKKEVVSTNSDIISEEERNKKIDKEVPSVTNRRSRIKPAVNIGRKLKVNLKPNEDILKKDETKIVTEEVPTHVQVIPEETKKNDNDVQLSVEVVPTKTPVSSMNIQIISEKDIESGEVVQKRVTEVSTETSVTSRNVQSVLEEEKKIDGIDIAEEVLTKTSINLGDVHTIPEEEKNIDEIKQNTIDELPESEKKIDGVIQRRVEEVSFRTSDSSMSIKTIPEKEVKIDEVVKKRIKEGGTNALVSSTNAQPIPEKGKESVELQPIEEVSSKTAVSLTHVQEIPEGRKKIDEAVQTIVGEVSTKTSVSSMNIETISENEVNMDAEGTNIVKGEVTTNTQISSTNAQPTPEEEKKSVELQPIEEVSTRTPVGLTHVQETPEGGKKIDEAVQTIVGEVSTKTLVSSMNIGTISENEVKMVAVGKKIVKGEVTTNTQISSTNAQPIPEEEKESVELQPIEEVSTKTPVSLTHVQEIPEGEKKIDEVVQTTVGEVSTKSSVSSTNIETIPEIEVKIGGIVKKSIEEEVLTNTLVSSTHVQSIPERENQIDEVVSTTPKTLVRRGRIKNIVKIPQRLAKKKSEEKTSVAESEINLKEESPAGSDLKNNESKITAGLESSVGEPTALKEMPKEAWNKEKNTNIVTIVICKKSEKEKLEKNDSGADLISSCSPTESTVNSNEKFEKMEEEASVSNENEDSKQDSKSNKDVESNLVTITSPRGRAKRGCRIGDKSLKDSKDEKSGQMEIASNSSIECNDVNGNEMNKETNKSKSVISEKDCNKDDLVVGEITKTNQIYKTALRGRGERKRKITLKSAKNEMDCEKYEICNNEISKEDDEIGTNLNESMININAIVNNAIDEAMNNVEQPSCNTDDSKNIGIVKEKEEKMVEKTVSTVNKNLNVIDEKGKKRRKVSTGIIDNLMEETNAGNNCKVEEKKELEENMEDEKQDSASRSGRIKRRIKGTSILDFIKKGKETKVKKEQNHRIYSRSSSKGENVKDQTTVCKNDEKNESEVEKIESEELIIYKEQGIKVNNKLDKIALNTKNKIFSRNSVKKVNAENDTEEKVKSSKSGRQKQLESMEFADILKRSIIEKKSVEENKTPKKRRRKNSSQTPDSASISHSPSNIHQSGRHAIKKIEDKITTDFDVPESDDLKSVESHVEGNLINKTFNRLKSEQKKQRVERTNATDKDKEACKEEENARGKEEVATVITKRVEGSNGTDKEACKKEENGSGKDEVTIVVTKRKRGRKSKAELAAIAELEKQARKRERSSSPEEMLPKRAKKVDYVSLSGAIEKEEKVSRKRKLSPAPEPKPKKKKEGTGDELEQYTRSNQTKIMIRKMVGDMQKLIDENTKVWKEKKRKMEVNGIVICIVCNKEIKNKEWHIHKYRQHNNLAWRVGEQPMDLSENNVNTILNLLYKNKKCMYCTLCKKSIKSPYGFLCHYITCGKTLEELEFMKIECKICGTLSYEYTYMDHVKAHSKPVNVEIPETLGDKQIDKLPNGKRIAARRANTIIKNVSSQICDEDNECELKKFYTKRILKKPALERIFAGRKQKIQCIYTKCKETFNQIVEMCEHLKNCTKRGKDIYICKLCASGFESVPNVLKHLKAKHEDEIEENYDFSGDEEIEEEHEEEPQVAEELVTKQSTKSYSYFNEKWKSYCLKFCSRTKYFVDELSLRLNPGSYLRNLAFCEKNFTQDVFGNFPFIRSNFIAVDPLKIMDYLPKQKQSIEVGFQEISSTKTKYEGQFKRLKLFEIHNHLGRITTYCGGPITCMAWAPTPYTSQKHNQVLAVSVMTDYDATYTYTKRHNEKSVIQFWNYGVLNNNDGETVQAKFEFALAHNFGPILSMEWCPSGCNNKDRLGLLAVSGSDGNVYGFAIGQPGKIKDKIVTAKPCFKLVLDRWIDIDLGNQKSFPTRIFWTKAAGHSFISVGYSSGMVAIFNLMTENNLLTKNDGETVVFYPYIKFQAHLSAITGISLHFLNGGKRWLATGSDDKESKFWDLDDLSNPIWIIKRFYTRQLIWLQNWLCTIEAFDDYGKSVVHPTSAVYIKDFGSPHSVTLLHTSSQVGAISISDWGNLVMQGNDGGEVSGCYNKHYFPFQSDLICKKYFLGKLIVIPNEDSKNKDKNNFYKERSFQGASNMFKMVFADLPLKQYASVMKYGATATSNSPANFTELKSNRYSLESVSYLAINPNRYSFLYNAVGYRSGFLRVFRSDFLKRNILPS